VIKQFTQHTNFSSAKVKNAWAAYGASALALLYAAVSLYWVVGGTAGLATVGGQIADMARVRDPAILALGWLALVLKVVIGLLALALAQRWGQRLPSRLLLNAAWGATAVLILDGGVMVSVGSLVLAGVIVVPTSVDWLALRWHVWLWDLWFLAWGLLLGFAIWLYQWPRLVASGDMSLTGV
jgi:hypothetical protein